MHVFMISVRPIMLTPYYDHAMERIVNFLLTATIYHTHSQTPLKHTCTHTALIDLDLLNRKEFSEVSPGFYELALSAATLNVIWWFALVCLPFIQVRVHRSIVITQYTTLAALIYLQVQELMCIYVTDSLQAF